MHSLHMSSYVKWLNSLQIHQMHNFFLILGLTPNQQIIKSHQPQPLTPGRIFHGGGCVDSTCGAWPHWSFFSIGTSVAAPKTGGAARGFHLTKLTNSTLQGEKDYQDLAMTRKHSQISLAETCWNCSAHLATGYGQTWCHRQGSARCQGWHESSCFNLGMDPWGPPHFLMVSKQIQAILRSWFFDSEPFELNALRWQLA